jgi:transposase InsO family protein
MKNKNDVLACFKHFHKAIQTQYDAMVKALRSDDGTEYTNNALEEYLSTHGIHHQTTYPYTPAQNGIAERKNTLVGDSSMHDDFYEYSEIFVGTSSHDSCTIDQQCM